MNLLPLTALTLLLASQTSFSSDPLSGQWLTHCTPLIKRHSIISRIDFSDAKLFAQHQLFADKNCQTLNLEITSHGEHSEQRNKFNWTLNKIVLKLLSPEVVDHYNKKSICGYTDWKLDEERDIAGRFCDPIQNPATNVTYHDKFKLRSNTLKFTHFPEIPKKESRGSRLFKKPLAYESQL